MAVYDEYVKQQGSGSAAGEGEAEAKPEEKTES
jgi:hypothetical protein